MAITSAQQADLYRIAVGMFGAAPGLTYIDALAQAINAGMTIPQIYNQLQTLPEFQGQAFGFTDASTNDQFAAAFIDKLLDGTVTAANRTIAINFVTAQLNAGQTRGQAMQTAINALDAIPSTDPNFGAAAQRFDNQIEVARHFTEVVGATTTDLNALRNAIAPVTQDVATVATTEAANLGAAGTQITLKTDAETATGTGFNDQINGFIDTATPANSTFTAGDNVSGGAGTDRLSITVTGNAPAVLPPAQVSGVEQFFIRDLNTGGLSTYDFSLVQGETTVANDRSTQAVSFTNVGTGSTVSVIGDGTTTVGATTFKMEGATSGTSAVTLNITGGVKGGANITRNDTGNAAITINSSGAANTVGTIDLDTGTALTALTINATSDLTGSLAPDFAANSKLTVTGTNLVDLLTGGAALSANLATVDATAQTGGGTRVILGSNTTSFKGGAGNDVVAVDALVFNATGTLDGGAGIDTIRVNAAAALTSKTAPNITNFEVLRIGDPGGAATFDASLISGIVAIELDASANPITVDKMSATEASAVTIRGTQGGTGPVFNVTGASTVGQLDVLGITIDDGLTAKNTITVANITAPGVETVNLKTVDNLTLSSMTGLGALTNMNISGGGNVNATTGALVLNVNTVINATGETGTVTINASAATTNGAQINGSLTKVNTITGTNQADVITGGSANDAFTAGGGNDTLDISQGGTDTLTFGAFGANGKDTITGFTTGATTSGGDVMNFKAFDAALNVAAPVAVTNLTGAAPIAADAVEVVAFGAALAGKDFSGADFTTLFGAGKVFSLTPAVNGEKALIIVQGTDVAQVYEASDINTAGTWEAGDLNLVGVLNGVTGGIIAANLSVA